MIEAELPDGTVLEFPEGTSPDVVQRVVKQRLGVAETPEPSKVPEVAKPVEQKSMLGALGGAIGGAGIASMLSLSNPATAGLAGLGALAGFF
jgi:hypothetical protein